MPLSEPRNRDFNGGTIGQPVPTPSGATLVGPQPVYAAGFDGTTGVLFGPSSGVSTYYQDFIPATSDYGQFTGEFTFPELPAGGNAEIVGGLRLGGITWSYVLTTWGGTLLRDGGGGSTITGWANPNLVANTRYKLQVATQKGTTTSNGIIKAVLTRVSDGTILASGYGEACNTGVDQNRGAFYGKRSTTGTMNVVWENVRISDQALDFLELPIPTPAPPETPESAVDAVAGIGDSTTDRGGSGPAQVKSAILGNGQGFTSPKVQINGLSSRTINYDNGVHPTALEQIDVFRGANYDPGIWWFAVGGNGGASDLAQQKTWIMDLLNSVAAGPRPKYKVILFGFARQDPANADAARFWQAISETTAPSKIELVKVNYNAELHNGRSHTGLWQSTSPTEAHMTAAGYTIRDQIMAPYITKMVVPPTASNLMQRVIDMVTDVAGDIKNMVNKSSDQTIEGVKEFVRAPIVPDGSFSISKIVGLATEFAKYAKFAQSVKWVTVDANGNWPTSYDANGSPVYGTGATPTTGVRPSSSPTCMVIWIGRDKNFPPTVPSGQLGPHAHDLLAMRSTA